jgi:2-aminoadipate transaminase
MISSPDLANLPYPSLAKRATSFEASPWAAALDLISRHPDPIYFGNGAPAREAVPIERLQEAAVRAWEEADGHLEYGELDGYLPLREFISERMARRRMIAPPDEIMILNGSQQGIDLVAKLLLDAGDTIVVEGPTYIGAMQTFDAYEVNYLVVPVDDEGIDVAALARMLDAAPVKPKLIYTVPTFQNPTGVSMSPARRQALVDLARARGIALIEDDPYHELHYGGEPELPLRALDPAVFYLGSFSKTIAPGVRVGWIAAPAAVMGLLAMAKESVDIHTNRVVMRTIFHASAEFLDQHVAVLRDHYRLRRDTLLEGLSEYLPEPVRWTEPDGGFFVWVTLPPGKSADELLPIAAQHGVAFLPGSWFYPVGQKQAEGFRLSFSSLPIEKITDGTRRLGEAITDYLSR